MIVADRPTAVVMVPTLADALARGNPELPHLWWIDAMKRGTAGELLLRERIRRLGLTVHDAVSSSLRTSHSCSGAQVLLPTGATVIQPGDLAVIAMARGAVSIQDVTSWARGETADPR